MGDYTEEEIGLRYKQIMDWVTHKDPKRLCAIHITHLKNGEYVELEKNGCIENTNLFASTKVV